MSAVDLIHNASTSLSLSARELPFLAVPMLHPFVRLIRATSMILTGEIEVLGEKLVPVLLIHMGSNPDLRVERPAINCLCHGTAWAVTI